MAKSLFEPKKIVRYANNQELIQGGLAGQSTPPRQVSATRSVPKVDSIPADASNVGSSNTPVDTGGSTGDNNPPPPPVPAGESRAFSFDGATELTGSIVASYDIFYRTIKLTAKPAWSGDATGSWALVTLGTSGSRDYREEYKLENYVNYGPLFNTTAAFLSTASLSTADSASVNNEPGVDAADYTEVKFNWRGSWNENTVHRFKLFNASSPFQEITSTATKEYTRKEGSELVFVALNTAVNGVTSFKQQVNVATFQKMNGRLVLDVHQGLGRRRSSCNLNKNRGFRSGDVLYLEIEKRTQDLKKVILNGKAVSKSGHSTIYPMPTPRNMTSNDSISIGGLVSGSEGHFSGSIDQVAIYNKNGILSNRTSAADYTGESNLQMYYKFEGNVSASAGNNLDVVGTEIYVSSSL